MAGAAKQRAKKDRQPGQAGNTSSGSGQRVVEQKPSPSPSQPESRPSPPRNSPPSRYDGGNDPGAGAAPRSNPFMNMPGAEMPPQRQVMQINPYRNLDLGGNMLIKSVYGGQGINLPVRPPKGNSTGKPITIGLNSFNVVDFPSKAVYQYDILIGNGAEKRGLIMSVWESKKVQQALGPGWIFDGNKLAWSMKNLDKELKLSVDLDAEKGQSRPGRSNSHAIYVRMAKTIKFDVLRGYLNKINDWDNQCLEAINFLDHLLRESPSKQFTSIKRNFFSRGQQRTSLGGGIEAFKGVYQSIRAVADGAGKGRLSVNVDVANGTFWTEQPLHLAAVQVCKQRDIGSLTQGLKPVQNNKESPLFKSGLRRMRKIRVYASHRGSEEKNKLYVIDRFLNKGAKQHTFEVNNKQTSQSSTMSIFDYFRQKYNITLSHPDLPLVQMTKKGIVLPMECCMIAENQRYPFKLDERQTSEMIKFAVTPPAVRWEAIDHGLKMLNWAQDPYLNNYGLKIDSNRIQVQAKLLQNAKVGFGQGSSNPKDVDPKTDGRWRLDGKKFIVPNPVPLQSWGVCVIPDRRGGIPQPAVQKFIQEFIKIYIGHGGQIANRNPVIVQSANPGLAVEELWNKAGNQSQARPQMLVFIVPDKDSSTYLRIKKSCECRYGVVSQVMQAAHVMKCQAQYISNVCMKFNAKLGGTTAKALGSAPAQFKVPTMCIGADVSHGAPGTDAASMAAMTMSLDAWAARYAAQCATNGRRVEMITTSNITYCLQRLITHWVSNVGKGQPPQQVFYFRDGVSEGQYQHVLNQEVRDIRKLFNEMYPGAKVKFVVVVASKRHHIRFFPKPGDRASSDRNGNPLPGTLVESGVTHPYEYDFYLCAHSAIKGTARPVHYHVLMDEANTTVEGLQNMIYEHSYQYIRSTTPVSLFPAVYYAHLASNRATSHIKESSEGQITATKEKSGGSSSDGSDEEVKPLMEMPGQGGINTAMWYI